jgi:hypothetical protein
MTGPKADSICLLLIALIWVTAVLLVNPIGDFPLNDDWAYGSAVRTLVETGELRLSDWTGANLIAQVVWGALFCLPLGFSFTALRLSTLVLGLVGVLATYGLLREARVPAGLALFGALVLAFSPIYFALSFTFMSDVPFAAIATAASWLLLRGLHRDSCLEIVGGLALAGVAILIRQVGLALPFAFAAAYAVRYGLSIRRLLGAMLPVSAGFALQMGFEAWLRQSHRLPVNFGSQIDTLQMQLHQTWPFILGDATKITFYAFIYTGFFLFSFLIATHAWSSDRSSYSLLPVFGGIAVATTAVLAVCMKLMPLHGNILNKGGLGCCDPWGGDPSRAPSYFWISVTFIGVMGAILLVIELWRSIISVLFMRKNYKEHYPLAFALVAITVAFAPLPFLGLGPHGFYDRYLIVFLPWLMLTVVATNSSTTNFHPSDVPLLVSTASLLVIAAFAVAATHDYLAANRVRWVALNQLMSVDGVRPERIEGGFEFHGWYLYDLLYAHHTGVCCEWVERDYVVSYFDQPGYIALATYPIEHWLPWGRGNLIVQRRRGIPDAS